MRIDNMIEQRIINALTNNGILDPELYDIGIIPALYTPPGQPSTEQLFGAVVCLAARIPGREFDRVEHMAQLREPYGPQQMYDSMVKELLAKIGAENEA